MERYETGTLSASRQLAQELRDLGTATAPATLLPAVLRGAGLADAYAATASPLGPVFVAYNDHGISAVLRVADAEEFERIFAAQFGRRAVREAELPRALADAVARHLEGGRAPLRFDLRGRTDFERRVLRKALEIPRGEVRPYGWVAREIGAPKAVRAVGTALGHNPIPLLIPCHRVVNSNGRIGHYSMGGSAAKRAVLAVEGVDPDALEAWARHGQRFHASDTTHIYCFPTCRHARRVSPQHRVTFASAGAAAAAGYHPCKVCRPA